MSDEELMLVVLRFNEKINQQDLEGLAELMTKDHTFCARANNTQHKNNGVLNYFPFQNPYQNLKRGTIHSVPYPTSPEKWFLEKERAGCFDIKKNPTYFSSVFACESSSRRFKYFNNTYNIRV